jgi:hypothetical protein
MAETAGKYFEIARRQPAQPVAQSAGGAGAGGKAPDIKLFENMKAAGKVTADVYAQFGDVRSYVQSMKSSYGIDPTRVTDPTNQLEVRANQQYQQSLASLYTNMNSLQNQQKDYASARDKGYTNPDVRQVDPITGEVHGVRGANTTFNADTIINTEKDDSTEIHNSEYARETSDKDIRNQYEAATVEELKRLEIKKESQSSLVDKAATQAQIDKIKHPAYNSNVFDASLRKAKEKDPKAGMFDMTLTQLQAGDSSVLMSIPGVSPAYNQSKDNMYNPVTGKWTFTYKGKAMQFGTKGRNAKQQAQEWYPIS